MFRPAMVAHILNSSIWEAESGRVCKLGVPGQSGLHSETVSQKTKFELLKFWRNLKLQKIKMYAGVSCHLE